MLRKGNIVTIMEQALSLVKKADVKYLSVFELIGVRLGLLYTTNYKKVKLVGFGSDSDPPVHEFFVCVVLIRH